MIPLIASLEHFDAPLRATLRSVPEKVPPGLVVWFPYGMTLTGIAVAGLIWWHISHMVYGWAAGELLLVLPLGLPAAALAALAATRVLLCIRIVLPTAALPASAWSGDPDEGAVEPERPTAGAAELI